MAVLAHGAFFLGLLATTLLLDSPPTCHSVSSARGRSSPGSAFGAAGYVGLLTVTGPSGHAALQRLGRRRRAAGRPRRRSLDRPGGALAALPAIADTLRAVLPIGSAMLTVAIGVLLIWQPEMITGPARVGVAVAVGSVAVAVLARQTLLLVDRERVIGSRASPDR